MKKVFCFNADGIYTGSKTVDENYKLNSNEFETIDGFVKPKLENGALVESATSDEIEYFYKEKQSSLNELLKIAIAELVVGAKKIADEIDGEDNYISAQTEIYDKKFLIANGEIPDVQIGGVDSLQIEASIRGITLESLKSDIITKGNQSLFSKKTFLMMIELSRVKTKGHIERNEFDKVLSILNQMNSIKTDTPIEEIQNTMNSILTA